MRRFIWWFAGGTASEILWGDVVILMGSTSVTFND